MCWWCRARMRSSTPRSASPPSRRSAKPTQQGAISEWDAEFRSDISAFLIDELIEAQHQLRPPAGTTTAERRHLQGLRRRVSRARRRLHGCHRPPRQGTPDHRLRCAASTCHSASIVSIRCRPPKRSPTCCKEYRIGTVIGDNFCRRAGLLRRGASTASPTSSPNSPSREIYLEVLPLFTRGLVSPARPPQTVQGTALLERRVHRSGKDSVDHGRSGHDDYANAVCGCLRSLAFASCDAGTRLTATPTSSPAASPSHSSTLRRKRASIGKRLAAQIAQLFAADAGRRSEASER